MYTDEDLAIATQIAYCDLSEVDITKITNGEKLNIKKLLENNVDCINDLKDKRDKHVKGSDGYNELQGQIDILNDIKANKNGWGDWKIVNIKDDNADSGFYGCTIETGDGSAIVAFRGSESETLHDVKTDWIDSDIGLLGSTGTKQQLVTTVYMHEMAQLLTDKYDDVAVTGHSLGGNLSLHGAVTAPKGLQDIISQVVSFDGPNFSDEYIDAHREAIDNMSGKMKHIQYSIVGSLLKPLPGVEEVNAVTDMDAYGKPDSIIRIKLAPSMSMRSTTRARNNACET
jgi:hypothetical protein